MWIQAVRGNPPLVFLYVSSFLSPVACSQITEKNRNEASIVVFLVRMIYQGQDYAIITPYDAKRKMITDMLKDASLRWDNVHNVDSFQGLFIRVYNLVSILI